MTASARKTPARKTPATRKPGGPVSRAEFSELAGRVKSIEDMINMSKRKQKLEAAKKLAADPNAVAQMRELLDMAESQVTTA